MAAEPDAGPYATSLEHLYDELRRVEWFVRAQVERWHRAVGEVRVDTEWGTGILDPREVVRFLGHPFVEPLEEPDVPDAVQAHVVQATRQTLAIRARREQTDASLLRLQRLRTALLLQPVDLDVVLVCLLGELDARYRRLFAYLADERWVRSPSVGLLAEILRPGPEGLPAFRGRFAPDAPLVRHQVVRVGEGPAGNDYGLSTRSVTLDERIAGFLTGQDHLEGWLASAVTVAEPLRWDQLVIPEERLERLRILTAASHNGQGRAATFALIGAEGSGRTSLARCMATELRIPLLLVDVRVALEGGPDFAGELYREARLRDAAVMWRGCERLVDREAEHDRLWAELLTAAARHTQPTFVDHSRPWDPPFRRADGGAFLRVPCPSPGLGERRTLWVRLLRHQWSNDGADLNAVADSLASTFLLTPGRMCDAIAMSVELARQRGGLDAVATEADLREACRRQSSRRVMNIARPVEAPPGMTFDDIVLPPEKKQQLVALRDRIRNRPRVEELLGPGRSGPKGLVAMFVGSSGTGKTLAAGLLAKDLGRDLLKVDLSQVVSKWVGETEKNLDRLLSEAQDAHAILFFDEAEAIFGQRGTVSSAQDRYALQETSFLLQRIEEHEGPVILATNLRQNLDAAFSRRIQTIIEFQSLDDDARLRMWRLALSQVEHDVDDEEITRIAVGSRLSAAAIVQVVLAATFTAVAREREAPHVTAHDIEEAVRSELQRVGLPALPTPKPVTDSA
jgi:SpoVK/Ycf46/Vps4 family AAA+-type ATPase